jgi:thiamine-phosphate pyrophosphorylase
VPRDFAKFFPATERNPFSNARLREFMPMSSLVRVTRPKSYNRPPVAFGVNGPLLRLLDANGNRAREALRVLEDHARFVLDDDALTGELKRIRHDLVGPLRDLLAEAVLHRDTPGDVGTSIKTEGETTREDLGAVVTAAGKRLGEALRAISECLKTLAPARAGRVELLRYRFYDVEKKIALTIRPGAVRFAGVRLYVLITESMCAKPWLETAELALEGGADCLQLREKDLESGELLRRAEQLVQLCRKHNALCIINDRPDVATLARADGVHVGQGDTSARLVRQLVGGQMILGVSTHNLEQAKRAVQDGADYVGVGPMYPSATKPRDFVAGPAYAKQVAKEIRIPAVAIAGISAENVDEVRASGVRAIAVTAAVTKAADPRAAAQALKAKLVN